MNRQQALCYMNKKIKLNPHQLKAVKHLLRESVRGLLCAFSTGGGKSLTAVAAAKCLVKMNKAKNIICITKLAIIDQFKREFRRFWPAISQSKTVHITTLASFNKRAKFQPAETFLIVDEAHALRNPQGKFTRRVVAYARKCPKTILLTATPFVNLKSDLSPLLAMCTGGAMIPAKTFNAMSWTSILAKFRNNVSYFRINKNTSPDFPSTRYIRHKFKNTTLGNVRNDAFMTRSRIQSITKRKQDWIVSSLTKWIKQKQRKAVIYVEFVDKGVNALVRRLAAAGINTSVITGGESQRHRTDVMARYNRDPQRVMRSIERRRNLRRLVVGENPRPMFQRVTLDAKTKRYAYSRIGGSARVTPAQIEQINKLAIPPPWTPAVIFAPNTKILWQATDKAGRTQSRYTQDWGIQVEYNKFLGLKVFTEDFFRRFIRGTSDYTKETNVAARLVRNCFFRPGKKKSYVDGHYGVLSLERRHVRIGRHSAEFRFIGKAGKPNVCETKDATIIAGLRLLAKGKKSNDRLFSIGKPALMNVFARYQVTPKMFRTFFACCRLISLLRGSPDSKFESVLQRRKRLLRAYEAISSRLNNTPKVAESSYVFRGLSAMYEREPMIFYKIIRNCKKVLCALQALVKYFRTNRVDWLRWTRGDKSANFTGVLDVLVISGAGAESLDLKRTRNVVFLTLPFTSKTFKQVVGRASRYRSHEDLPASERNVTVHTLIETDSDRKLEKIIFDKRECENRANAMLRSASI